jgi:hypothetical protein
MLRTDFPRGAYVTHAGRTRKYPRYTVGDLIEDAERHRLTRVFFHPDIDVDQSFEVTIEMMVELLRLQRDRNPKEASPVLLHVPKEGVGILTMNPGFKWRRGHRWHKLRRATR